MFLRFLVSIYKVAGSTLLHPFDAHYAHHPSTFNPLLHGAYPRLPPHGFPNAYHTGHIYLNEKNDDKVGKSD